jgi:UDP-N-acetylmuramoylalanine--D-glutamate ligase
MRFLHDLSLLVLGLGDSGLAMARWAQRCGAARIVVADTREAPPHAARLAAEVPGAELRCGRLDPGRLDGIGLVLKSPGLSPLDPQVAPLLDAAAERGLLVLGELALFAHALKDLKAERGYAPTVLAVTGTNGKTTTTSMTALLVERCGLRVGLAGNIGPTMLDTLGSALDREPVVGVPAELPSPQPSPADAGEGAEHLGDDPITEDPLTDEELNEMGGGPPPHLIPPPPPAPVFEHLPDAWVLELSSFQLDNVTNFEATAAAVLNVTQDHLDWHGDMAAYAGAKQRIFGKQAVMVVNRGDTRVEAMAAALTAPPPAPLSANGRPSLKSGKTPKAVPRHIVRFGLDVPHQPGDFGLVDQAGMAWLVRAHELDETLKRRKGDEPDEITLQRLMPADALRIRGRHNAANALAALALATAAGLPLAPMLHGLREYAGEPHRVQHLLSVRGIDAYDDSKGTNVGATVAALAGLGADKAPNKLVVILGGEGKGQDFSPLAQPVSQYVRAVATLGRDAAAIEAALDDVVAAHGLPLQRFDALEAATRWCFEQAHAGDAVLLSPACASFDMFRHYAHRAEVFARTVAALADEAGEVAL